MRASLEMLHLHTAYAHAAMPSLLPSASSLIHFAILPNPALATPVLTIKHAKKPQFVALATLTLMPKLQKQAGRVGVAPRECQRVEPRQKIGDGFEVELSDLCVREEFELGWTTACSPFLPASRLPPPSKTVHLFLLLVRP